MASHTSPMWTIFTNGRQCGPVANIPSVEVQSSDDAYACSITHKKNIITAKWVIRTLNIVQSTERYLLLGQSTVSCLCDLLHVTLLFWGKHYLLCRHIRNSILTLKIVRVSLGPSTSKYGS